jgi:hypothetical protein
VKFVYEFPWTSSRFSGTSGSFGAFSAMAEAPTAFAPGGFALIAGGGVVALAGALFAGSEGLTAAFPILGGAFSLFAGALAGLALASFAAGEASVSEAAAVSASGALFHFAGGSFFTGCAFLGSFSDPAAGVVGMIDEILSFSTSTYPKSVLTLNMLSSYATITPYSFFPSFSRISSACAQRAIPQHAAAPSAAARTAPRQFVPVALRFLG